jgi:hypothetical protein
MMVLRAHLALVGFVGIAAPSCASSGDSAPPTPSQSQAALDGGAESGTFGDASSSCRNDADCPPGSVCQVSTTGEVGSRTCVPAPGGGPDGGEAGVVLPPDAAPPTSWGRPWALALDASKVYWTDNEPTGAVLVQTKGGGAPTVLYANRAEPAGIAVDATNVYWTETGFHNPTHCVVMQAPLTGGAPTTLWDGAQGYPYSVVVDATSVYWIAPTNDPTTFDVMKLPIGGGAAVTLATDAYVDFPGNPHALAVDATSVYYPGYDYGSQSGTVLSVPIGGGSPTVLVTDSQTPYIEAIAIDGASVYYGSPLRRIPLAGGAAPVTISASSYDLAGLAVDGANAFFLAFTNMAKVPVGGGATTSLAPATANGVWDIAVDATSIFWTDVPHGGISEAPK